MTIVLALLFLAVTSSLASPISNFKVDIVGGVNVTSATEYPYITAIKDKENNFISAGTIINSRHILTAASKVYYWRDFVSNLKLFVGSHLLDEGTPYDLLSIKIHEEFSILSSPNNIAILKTKVSIVFTPSVIPVLLVSREIYTGTETRAIGWGFTSPEGRPSEQLTYIDNEIMNNVLCNSLLPGVNEDNICTGGSTSKGVCVNDLGGPLIIPDEGQVGIQLDTLTGTCADGKPDIYTSVIYHIDWIVQNSQ